MANLKEVRTRIASVSSTKKITSAMKMVSAAKFKKAQNNLLKFRPFNDKITDLVHGLMAAKVQAAYLCPRKQERNVLLLLITSNNSLCGAFNSNIIKEAKREYERVRIENPEANVCFYCIGSKGEDVLRREGFSVIARNHDCIDKPSVGATKHVFNDLVKGYRDGKFDRIVLVYNKFKNAATQELIAEPLIPMAKPEGQKRASIPPIVEPDKAALLDSLLPYYLQNLLHSAIMESHTAEHGARMTAMHQATENATALHDELLLEYNKARQAAITDEILEIVSGANALNG